MKSKKSHNDPWDCTSPILCSMFIHFRGNSEKPATLKFEKNLLKFISHPSKVVAETWLHMKSSFINCKIEDETKNLRCRQTYRCRPNFHVFASKQIFRCSVLLLLSNESIINSNHERQEHHSAKENVIESWETQFHFRFFHDLHKLPVT